MMPFFCIPISQGSAATCLKRGGIFKHEFVANLLPSRPVKIFWKSYSSWWSYGQEFGVLFFLTHGVVTGSSVHVVPTTLRLHSCNTYTLPPSPFVLSLSLSLSLLSDFRLMLETALFCWRFWWVFRCARLLPVCLLTGVADPVQFRKLLKSHYFNQAFNICWSLCFSRCFSIWLTFVMHLWPRLS